MFWMHLRNVLGFYCCCNKWPQPEWLKQHPFIISQFLWLSSIGNTWNSLFCAQSQNPGAGGAVLPPGGSRIVYKNPGPFSSWLSVWGGCHLLETVCIPRQFSSPPSSVPANVDASSSRLTLWPPFAVFSLLFLFSPVSNSSAALQGWCDYIGAGITFLFKVSGSVLLYPSAKPFPEVLRFVSH